MSTHPMFDDSRGENGGVVSQVLGGDDALVDFAIVWLQCISFLKGEHREESTMMWENLDVLPLKICCSEILPSCCSRETRSTNIHPVLLLLWFCAVEAE